MFEQTKAYSGFAVKDLDAAEPFYERLGLRVDRVYDGGILDLTLPGGQTHVMVYPKPDHEPATYTILNFPVKDVDAAVTELTQHGIKMERFEGFDQDERGIMRGNGPDIAWFRDPSGNILSVVSDEPM